MLHSVVNEAAVCLSAGFSGAPLLLKIVQDAIEAEQRALDEVKVLTSAVLRTFVLQPTVHLHADHTMLSCNKCLLAR